MSKNVPRILKTLISVSLVLSMLLPNVAYAVPEGGLPLDKLTQHLSIPVPVSDPGTSVAVTDDEAAPISRSLDIEALVEQGYVKLDAEGNVTAVKADEDSGLTPEDAEALLLGGVRLMSNYEPPRDPSMLELGISEAQEEHAYTLHGSQLVFQTQINALLGARTRGEITDDDVPDLTQLICSGFSFGEARAALISAPLLGCSLEEACAAKEALLTPDEETDPEDLYSQYDDLAVTLGLPSLLVEEKLEAYDGTSDDLLAAYHAAREAIFAALEAVQLPEPTPGPVPTETIQPSELPEETIAPSDTPSAEPEETEPAPPPTQTGPDEEPEEVPEETTQPLPEPDASPDESTAPTDLPELEPANLTLNQEAASTDTLSPAEPSDEALNEDETVPEEKAAASEDPPQEDVEAPTASDQPEEEEPNAPPVDEGSTGPAERDDLLDAALPTTLAADGKTYYTPDLPLSDPFGYQKIGQFDTNLASGTYIFSETDLSIPGVNGLDLNVVRQYDSSNSMAHIPVGAINTNYNEYFTIGLELQGYVTPPGGTYYKLVSNWQDYTFSDRNLPQQIFDDMEYYDIYSEYTTERYDEASLDRIRCDAYIVGGWYYAVKDRYGDSYIMRLRPVLTPIGRFDDAFENIPYDYDYTVNEFGLGHGWRLGFSAIETYITELFGPKEKRLITSNGYKYKIGFTATAGDSNLVDYDLTDLRLEDTGNGYPGASYTLFHADGKKEYFDSNGRNIAIVDRYGNTIKLEYTFADSRQEVVSQIKITDTLGNVVLYKDEKVDYSVVHQVPGLKKTTGRYNTMWTLSLNGETIRTYYSYTNSTAASNYQARILNVMDNELSEHTTFGGSATRYDFNCFTSAPSTCDAIGARGGLGDIEYPNGVSIGAGNRYYTSQQGNIFLGEAGYMEQGRLGGITTHYNVDDEDYVYHLNEIDYVVPDLTGYYEYQEPGDFTVTETLKQYHQMQNDESGYAPRYVWNSQITYYTFNTDGELTKKEVKPCALVQDETLTGDFSETTKEPIGTLSTTTYTYNKDHLPLTANTKWYQVGSTSSYMSENRSYTYDKKGNILTETLPNGQTITYTYSPDYNIPLTKTYKQDASTTIVETNTLTSDKKAVAAATVTSNGTTVSKATCSYDTKGRITSQNTYTDNTNYTQQQFVYGNGSQVTESKTLNVKNADGALVSGSPGYSAGTVVEKMSYNTRGWPISQTDGAGNTTTLEYDATGRIIKATHPDGSFATYSYLISYIDGKTNGINKVTYTDENGAQLIYTYDPFGNQIQVFDPTSNRALVDRVFDSRGFQVLETIHTLSGKDQSTYTYYDHQGRLIEAGIRNPDGSNTPLETYTYHNPTGKTTHTVYGGSASVPNTVTTTYKDNMGYVVKTGRLLGGTEHVDTYTNDYLGNPTQLKSAYTASIGGAFTTRTAYDYAGRPTAVTNALNQTVAYGYDWQGNRIYATDAKGVTATNTYDALGRLVKTTQPFAGSDTAAILTYYDGAGNVTQQKIKRSENGGSPLYNVTDYTFNGRGWLTKMGSHVGGSTVNYTQYWYDKVGNPLRMYTGLTTPLTITGLDQVSGGSAGYSTTKYTYDKFGHQLTMTDPVGQTESATYDLNGNTLTKTDRNGNVTTNTYDARGRLTNCAVVTPSGRGNVTNTYTYALNGQKLTESGGGATTTFQYDALGRTTRESYSNVVKAYAYNIGDLRTSFTVSVGGTQQINNAYTYDALGRLTQVSGSGVTAGYTYDANGNRTATTYNNGTQETFAYNKANLVTQVVNKKGASVLSQFDYTYDLAGRQLSKTDQNGKVSTYAYDDLGQLTSEGQTQGGTSLYQNVYQYDSRNNRKALTADGAATAYILDGNNRLLSVTAPTVTTNYSYDRNGNQLTATISPRSSGGGMVELYGDVELQPEEPFTPATSSIQKTYDGLNRLTAVTTGNSTSSYAYQPNGLRSGKTVDGTAITYVWDGSQLVLEQKSSVFTKYIRGLGLAAAVTGSDRTYYLYNAHGDVVQLTDASGAVTRAYDYDAFGNELSPTASDTNPFRYCGEYYDKETGTYYLRARNYDPVLGRMTSEDSVRARRTNLFDPYGNYQGTSLTGGLYVDWEKQQFVLDDPLSLNLYTYCANNPVSYADPNGHWIHIIIGAAVGAVASSISSAVIQYITTGAVDAKTTLIAAGSGALGGALAASGAGIVLQVVGNGAISGAADLATQLSKNGGKLSEVDGWSIAASIGAGMLAGKIGGSGANQNNYLGSLSERLMTRMGNAFANKTGSALRTELKKALINYIKSSGTTNMAMVENIIRSNIPAVAVGGTTALNNLIKDVKNGAR